MNILFFTLSAGEGHNQVANTLAGDLFKADDKHKIQIIDAFKYIHPKLHKILLEAYVKSIQYFPELYGYFYKKTSLSNDSFYCDIEELFNRAFIIRKFNKLINSFNPHVIICTHPIPAEALSILKRKGKINIPIINTITDYSLHSAWLNEEIDYYVLPSDFLKNEIRFWNIPEEKCKYFGIPIRNSFLEKSDRQEICDELGLNNTFTALIMGGGLGLGNIAPSLDCLANYGTDIQTIVLTGKNKVLYRELKSKYNSINTLNNVKIYDYLSYIHKIMTISDVIITKPGGLTITEAIIKELPMIITSILPGQEEKNAEFLLENKIGMIATNPNDLLSSITTLRNNPKEYNVLKKNMIRFKKPKATQDIVNLILKLDLNKKTFTINNL